MERSQQGSLCLLKETQLKDSFVFFLSISIKLTRYIQKSESESTLETSTHTKKRYDFNMIKNKKD